jgi:2-keto-4-pentenoate hydratase/2-oxohepta-3-ene-1,7-dioic acid hydratase in catechol pathway
MKIVVFGPERRVGALLDDRVVDLNLADARVPATLDALIAGGSRVLGLAGEVAGRAPENAVVARDSVKLHAPTVYRARIACAGGNFALHAAGAQEARTGQPVSVDEMFQQTRKGGAWGFWKVVDPPVGDGDDVVYPARATHFDYEGELAIVLSRPAKDVRAADVMDYVWGITLLNDWSVRNDMGPGRPLNFNLPKNFDTSVSVGPCVCVGSDAFELQNVVVETRVNGQVRQHYNSAEMVFSFGEFLEHLSRDFTFLPGDLISGGTGAGTAMDTTRPAPDGSTPKDLFLKVGDSVEVSSPPIGTLHNRIVAK